MNQPYTTFEHGLLERHAYYPNFFPNRQQRRNKSSFLSINNRKSGNSRLTKLQVVPLFDEDKQLIGFKNIYHKNYVRMMS